jgi:rRNA maturation protein Nop10
MEAVMSTGNLQALDRLPEVCPECGTALSEIVPASDPTVLSEQGMKCPQCGWAVVGTYVPPMWTDETTYRVYARQTAAPNVGLLRLASRELRLGIVQTRALIRAEDVALFEGEAREVYGIRQLLDNVGANYYITPDFSY